VRRTRNAPLTQNVRREQRLSETVPELKLTGLTMPKRRRKLTPREKAEKKRRRREYMIIFVNGRQKRIKRPPTIDGMDVDEFIRANADPTWLHQNELWEYMDVEEEQNK